MQEYEVFVEVEDVGEKGQAGLEQGNATIA